MNDFVERSGRNDDEERAQVRDNPFDGIKQIPQWVTTAKMIGAFALGMLSAIGSIITIYKAW